MTAVPQTPVSTRSGLVSPLSTASTLVDLTGTVSKRIHLDGEPSEVNASLVKQKLREALSPAEFDQCVGKAPSIVVIGRESVGKSSVLNALTNIPLFVAAKTATRAPTRIESIRTPHQGFRAQIKIETTVAGDVVRQHAITNQDITMMNELQEAAHLAADEARRLELEPTPRPYESVSTLTPSQRAEALKGAPEYTSNSVVISVSGPDQDDLDLVDLPGLGKAPTAQAVKAMIREHVSKSQNIIIHCMAACGGSPTMDECVQMNIEADPKGDRSMIILTQVDNIQDPTDDSWVDLISGEADVFDGWRPQLGVHPLRLAGPRERKAGISTSQMRTIESQLFASADWQSIKDQTKSAGFGVAHTRNLMLNTYKEHADAWLQGVPAVLQGQQEANRQALALLPHLPEQPVASLHTDVIARLAEELRHEINGTGKTCGDLVDLQKRLTQDMFAAMPLVIPLLKKDEASLAGLKDDIGDAWLAVKEQRTKVWIDDVLQARNELRHPRSGVVDDTAIVKRYVVDIKRTWEQITQRHVVQVWDTVTEAINAIAASRKSMSVDIMAALFRHRDHMMFKTKAYVKETLEVVGSDPAQTTADDGFATVARRKGDRYTQGNFVRLYQSPTAKLAVPKDVDVSEIMTVLALQNSLDTRLSLLCFANASITGQRVQYDIISFLDGLEAILRSAFELDQVVDRVQKRASGLFETKTERAKRAKLTARASSLQEIETLVESLT